MDNQEEKKNVKESVLDAIQKGRVKMVPRWHFILKTSLFVLGVVIVLLASLYVISFIFFTVNRSGILFAPEFGSRGLIIFLRSLPWFLIILSLVFLGILEILVKRYSFAYRKPLIVSVLGILTVALVAGAALSPIHRSPPPPGPGWGGMGMGFRHHQPPEVYRGTVERLTSSGFVLDDLDDDSTSSIVISGETRVNFSEDLATSVEVIVFGEEFGGTVRAFGIRILK